MALIRQGHLLGFIICGQVCAKCPEYKTIVIDDDRQWAFDPKIKSAWNQIAIVENNHLVAAANLLSFIINNLNPVQRKTVDTADVQLSDLRLSAMELSRHEKKRVAAHVCFSANYFSRFFKKRQGANFKTWVSQKKCSGRVSCCAIRRTLSTASPGNFSMRRRAICVGCSGRLTRRLRSYSVMNTFRCRRVPSPLE